MKRVSYRKLRRARQTARSVAPFRRPRPLGVSLARYGSIIAIAGALFAGVGSVNADTLYKADSGTNSFLDIAFTTPTAPGAIIQNYSEGTVFTGGDTIVFNNGVTAASTFLVSGTAAFNLQLGGLKIGSLFNGTLLNPGGAITISNSLTQTQTVTLGASGIDMSLAGQNLTFANAATGTLNFATSADQTWTMRTGRTLSLAAVPFNLANNLTLQGAGTVAIGNATAGNAISGAGNLTLDGAQSGGASVVTLSGNNSTWTGAVTVGSPSPLRTGVQLNIDQLAAAQNKLADGQALTINHGTVNLQGTLAGTETVASVSLGQGLNAILRSAGTGVLQSNGISFGTGAGLNVGNIGTVAGSSYLTTDNLNNNLILGTRMVAINGTTDTNWVKNATGAADGAVIAASGADYATNNALDTWTVATQNILMTATGTASTLSRTINSLKIAHATAATTVTADIGAGNTLTLNDGFNGGGIIRNQNGATTIGNATVGVGNLTAGTGDDSINDTLSIWNSQNTMTINNVIKDNNTGVGTDTLHLFTGGAGTTTIAATNTFTGGTTIGAGTLAIGANNAAHNDATLGSGDIVNFGTLVLSKTTAATLAQMTLANNITGTGAFTVNRNTVTLSGVNDYSGATTLGNANLGAGLRAGSATGISPNSRIIFNDTNAATLDLNGFNVSAAALSGSQTTSNVILGTNTLTLSGSDLANSGSAEILSLVPQNYQGAFAASAGNLIKNGGYTQVFAAGGAAAYTGTTTVNAGILQTNKALSTSALTINNDGSLFISNIANSLTPTTAVSLTSSGAIWRINNGFNQSVGPLSGVVGSLVDLQNGAGSITLTVTDNGGVPTVFNGVINSVAGAGSGSVIKEGTNTWVLGGGNAFSGGLTINGGIVQNAAANPVGVFGDFVPVILADVAGVALDINGNSASIGSLAGGGATGGNVTLGAAGRLTVGFNNTSTSFGGVISGGTAGVETLVKVGNGTMLLSGTNTFLGDVVIRKGSGGITLSGGAALDDTVNIRNFGSGSTLTVLTSETVGAVTGAAGTKIVLTGPTTTLTASYTDGTPTVLAATADTNSTAGRIVKGIDTRSLTVGTLISGTSIPAGSYIVQILDGDSVLINAVPTPTTTDFAPTITTTARLASDISGTGGFTKNGPGLLFLAGTSTYTGDTTINDGTIQVGGIWTGRDYSIQDQLSDNSRVVFGATGTQSLNFANSATNLLPFERIGSLAGGSVTSTINLTAGSSVAVLAFGGDNTDSTYSGNFLPASSAGAIVKEGTGTFTWNNPTSNTFDGLIDLRQGGFTSGNTGLDGSNIVRFSNNNTTFTSGVTDTLAILEGGAGVSRVQITTGFTGGLYGNHLTGTGANTVINGGTILTVSSTTSSGYNGTISGGGTLIKAGTSLWQIYGPATLTGETQVTTGTLRTGVLSGSSGVGAPGVGLTGTLSAASGLRITGGVLDINSTAQTALRINASSTGGTIQLLNGSLTLADQNTQTTATVFTGNLASVLNINASSAATLSLTGNNANFGGSINVGSNAALTLNRTGGALNSTGIPAANVNLNGTGTQLTVTLADTIGTLTGTGNAVLTQSLTLREAGSGTASAPAFTGVTSGAGGLVLSNFGGLTISGNLAHTGGMTLSSGSALNLNYGAGNNIVPTTGALTLNGGTVRVDSFAGVASILESAASVSLNAGASSVEALSNIAGYTGSGLGGLNLGAITRAAGGTLNVGRNAAATTTANSSGILGSLGYATFEGNTWAVGNGAGAAITGLASGAYTADGVGGGVHNDVTTGIGTGTAETLRFNGAAAVDQTAAITVNLGGILVTRNVGANTSTISGALNATGNELIIHQYNPLGDLVLSNVAGTNTIITTAGGGRTQITNSIAGTGTTNIGYGYLQLGDATVGGSTAGMVGSGLIRNDGTLGINRSNAQTLGAIISGTGNLEQLGTGTTTLSTANTFAGRVTVRGGILEVTNNTGLGLAATAAPNRWANLTSVNTGGTLLLDVTAGGALTEVLNLDGGTLDLRSTVATTLGAPIILTSDGTISVSNPGAAVSHLITGEIYALPGSDLTVTNVGGATPSTLVLAPSATTGSRWENTIINTDGRLQIGNNSRGFLGTGSVTNNGTLILNPNDANYVVGNTITGAGTLAFLRSGTNGSTWLTGDLSGFTGTVLVSSPSGINNSGLLELANDTYSPAINSAATINITANAFAGTSGVASLRTHYNQDVTYSNTINLAPANDGTNAKNAQLIRAGLGTVTFTGTINLGLTNAGTGTQRNLIQTEGGGKLRLNATIAGTDATHLLNIVNNGVLVLGGSASQTYNGILSGNNVWVFDNSGTTTLTGVNTVATGNSYLQRGTLVLGTGGANTWADNAQLQVLNGATLRIAGSETFDVLYSTRGTTVDVPTIGTTLTLDLGAAQLNAAQFTGAGNLTLAGGNYMAMYSSVANTISGNLQLGVTTTNGIVAATNLINAIGSFGSITLGAAGNTGIGALEYVGAGETFANNITVTGTNTTGNYIAANGSGALILSGNITSTSTTGILRLIGQTGGYFNPITNQITGIISDATNKLAIAMPNNGDDDRFGIASHWALTNASNDFSGNVTVNVGMLELAGDLKTGVEATSVFGDLTATRTITLGSNNFNGRRYDSFGNTDQLGDAGFSQGTNTLAPSGDVGTIIFNDPNAGTATLGSNISWSFVNTTTTNTTGAQLINNGAKQIIINGTFATNTTGGHILVLDGSNTLSNTLNSSLANPATSQTTAVIKEGAGTWRLGGTNTYTGSTTINDGILEIAGGAAITDSGTVALNADGGDGLFSGTTKLRVVNSETIGLLTGDILTEAEVLSGQTLTISAGNSTMNGLITGAGNLSRVILSGATGGTLTTSASNTYTGITTLGSTGTATANAGIAIYQIADGGSNSGLGSSSDAATNLVFTTNTAGTNGGILTWQGYTDQSTKRLFTLGLGTAGATIAASGTAVATTVPTLTFSNGGALAYTGSGTRTLTLTGTALSENVFRPLIEDSGGATTLSKTAAGYWLINPNGAGNTYTGGTSITGGTLAIRAGNALGSGTITINGGAGVGLEIQSGITLANNITNSTTDGGISIFSGTNVLSGVITATSQMRINVESGASAELNHPTTSLVGAGILLKTGDGRLILSGVNTATGAMVVRDGTLELNYATNNTSKLADAASLTLGGIGGLTVPGVDSTTAGQTKLDGQNGGTVHLNGGSHVEVVSATTIDPGSNAITRDIGSTAVLRMNAITRGVNQGTIDFGAGGIADTDTTNTAGILGTTTTGAFATVAKTDWAFNFTNGADGAINALAAYATDTYAAGSNTDITLAAANTGAATLNNTFRFNTSQATTLTLGAAFGVQGTAVGLQAGGILITPTVGAFTTIIDGGPLQNAASTVNFATIVHQHNAAGALQIDSVIQNNTLATAQGLTKTGAGKLFLNALNTYSGVVNLYEGEIQVGGTAAASTTATDAYLSGFGVGAGNASTAWNLAIGSTLRFLTTNTTLYNTPTITGDGNIILDAGNLSALLFDDNNDNFYGNITFSGGTIRVATQNQSLGNARGTMTVNNSVNFIFNTGITSNKPITYNEGTTFNVQNSTTTSTGTFNFKQTFANTTTAGLNFNLAAPTTAGIVGLNLSGNIYGSNGFTKTGDGILQLSANNFAGVYDGYTVINKTPTLSGQIAINGGILYVGGARALGAHGVGNEVIVASGASLDLRGQALNYGDDSDASRKIFKIQGTGFVNAQSNNTGALRNTTGTGQISFLTLDGNSTINSGGQVNASALVIGTFDTNLSNANGLTGAFTRNSPVIAGGGFDLTVQGGRVATDNFVIADPSFSSALGSLIISEGGTRLRHEVAANIGGASGIGVTAANITNGIVIRYGGTTAADLTGVQAGGAGNTSVLGGNVGARFQFENWSGTHHTVAITMDGAAAATASGTPGGPFSLAGGHNYLTADFFTIPDGTTYLDGTLNLTGAAVRNIIQNDSIGNYTVQEQGNLTVAPATKLVFGGVAQGAGGFTKNGQGDVRFTNTNTFTGDVNVVRFGASAVPFESHTYKINGVDYATSGLGEGWAEYSLTLNGANGAFTGVGKINLERRGMLTLDNTTRLAATSGVAGGNNNNRINDAALINLNHGWLRLNAGTAANTETFGTVNVNAGSNILDIYGTDGAAVNTTLTIGTLNRAQGGVLRITNLDATSTFGTAAAGDSTRVVVTTLGAGAGLIGGGGAPGTSTMSLVQGVLGGNAPIDLTSDLRVLGFSNGNISDLWNQQRNVQFASGSHFLTQEGGFTRPLDDSEYFDPASGLLNPTTAGVTTQNVNLNGLSTIMSQDTTINGLRLGALTDHNGTGATGIIDHHAISLLVDGTLKISSGMISSAYWTVGNTSSASTIIYGGTLDFNGKEAIINNQNAYYRTTDGTIQGGSLFLQSAITNANGLTKTGFQRVELDGANTYTGVTTISEGILDLRNGRSALGVGGAGNGVVIVGAGELRTNNGVVVGTPTAREDIYVGVLQADQQIARVETDVTVWNSNITIDNVDSSGQTIFTPRIRTDNSAVSIINGNIGGGNTPISNDVLAIDSRVVQFDASGNNIFVVRGQFGDRLDGSGNAIPIADPISRLSTVVGTRTNANEVLRVTFSGSAETNYILDRQYNAAGRLTLAAGSLYVNYNPAGGGLDGTGFWTNTALSKIANADSSTTAFDVNGATPQQGFTLTGGGVYLTTSGQAFNMASFTTSGTGAKFIGGLNESGTVTIGDGTGTLTNGGAITNFQAVDGGTVVLAMRQAGALGTAPNNFNFLKQGRGTVELQNSTAGATSTDSNFVLAGGTLLLNHTAATSVALVGVQNARFDGGSIISLASSGANTTENLATDNQNSRFLNFSIGGTEIVARTTNAGTARNSVINLGNANAGGTTATSNFLRALGSTANLVEDNSAGGTAQITLNFNATTTAAVKNQVIPWATFGTLARTATDFAMSDSGAANDVRAYGRALDEFNNNVATWAANQDVSENGVGGFTSALAAPLTLSTLRFDANADSVVDLGTNVLTVSGPGSNSFGGAILVSTNVGAANKTIAGGVGAALTTSGAPNELIIHQYGSGNLNINVPITGANNLVIAGPSTTNAATIGTTGAVVLGATNTYTGRTFLNGSVLSFNDTAQLGTNPGASTSNQVTLNGGTLRYSGRGFADMQNRGLQFDGNGGTIDVVEASGALRTDSIASNALYRGDLIKVGAGTLVIEGTNALNNSFQGLVDVREGTIRLNGDNQAATGTITSTLLGTTTGFVDGTIFRNGTNLAVQMGNMNDVANTDWNFDEWLTFEGNNYVTVGTINTQTGAAVAGFPNPNNERPVNLNGLNTIKGTVTFDVVPGQTLRLNNGGTLMTTGNGDIIKDGQGALQFQTNNPDFTGNITILQGRVYSVGQADPMGTGYLTGKTITLGSPDRQGIVELSINSDSISGGTQELNHAVNVVYNPAQAKRIYFETFTNGSQIEVNGNITLNDNLNIYINDAAEVGGSQNYVNINSKLLDGATTSGNLILHADDTGNANDNTNGRPYGYLVLKNDNSGWTGDIRVNANTGYDQDQTSILRLEHSLALTAANDVDMGFNSMLQVGGGARTIGALSTNGGVGPFLGDTAGGTMGAQTNGTTVVIENAATTAGTLTITQSTPAAVETVWNAYFRNGTLNSEFFAPGVGPVASAALNLVKAGSGWATITTSNGYTGTTTVTGGILQVGRLGVGDTGAPTAAGLTANAGTIIAGTGTIQGTTLINGNLRPGDEAGSLMGTLTVNGSLTLGATSITSLQVQRSSYTAFNALNVHDPLYSGWKSTVITTDPTYSHLGNDPVLNTQHDKLLITGGLSVSSGGKFVLSNIGYNPTAGDVFNVLDWTGAATSVNVGGIAYNSGVFRTGAEAGTDLDLFPLGNGFLWDVSQFNTTGALLVVQAPARTVYWNGDVNSNWNTNPSGPNTNWSDSSGSIDSGTIPFITDDVVFSSGAGTNMSTSLGQSFSINSLSFGQGTNVTMTASIDTGLSNLTVGVGGITMASGSAANSITSSGAGGVVLGVDQTWTNNDTINNLTVSAPISGANLTKAGPGKVIISGTNNYGSTLINGGTLQVGNAGTTGTLGSGPVVNNAALVLNRTNTQVVSNAISGTGSLEQAGTGTTVLTGANSYGATLISAGTLQLGNGGITGTLGAGAVTNNGALVFNRTDSVLVGNTIGGTGSLEQAGTGTTTLSATNNYTGPTTVSAGTLEITGSLSGTSGTGVTVNSGGTLLLNNNITNVVNSAANLTVAGGTVQLADAIDDKIQNFTNLTLSGTSTLDFGDGANGNTILVNNPGSVSFAGTLAIWNWSSTTSYIAGSTDVGSLAGDNQDRLLFSASTGFTAGQLSSIQFYSDNGTTPVGFGAAEIAFIAGGNFEIVPVPEPSSTALIGAAALLGLIGYRERARLRGRSIN